MTNVVLSLAILFFFLPRQVQGAFGRRGSSEPPLALPQKAAAGRSSPPHWSSTGSEGLDHTAVAPVRATAFRRAPPAAAAPRSKQGAIPEDGGPPQEDQHVPYAVGERHPYASGVFTIDPTFGMF
jgi:hypothetical protein